MNHCEGLACRYLRELIKLKNYTSPLPPPADETEQRFHTHISLWHDALREAQAKLGHYISALEAYQKGRDA